jgi:hypothetical protein
VKAAFIGQMIALAIQFACWVAIAWLAWSYGRKQNPLPQRKLKWKAKVKPGDLPWTF